MCGYLHRTDIVGVLTQFLERGGGVWLGGVLGGQVTSSHRIRLVVRKNEKMTNQI